MKIKILQLTCLVMAVIGGAIGCSESQRSHHQMTHDNDALSAIKKLENKIGLSLPTNSILVNFGDGGGRDPSHGFYEWVLFSPTSITLPIMRASGVNEHLKLPLADTVEFVESRMGSRKVKMPELAIHTEWQTNGYEFRATLVRSKEGDYLVIEQFKEQNGNHKQE